MRARRGKIWLAALMTVTLVAWPTAVRPAAAASPSDHWTTNVTMRTPDGWYAQPVHATLMPNGQVHMFGLQRSNWPPTPTDGVKGHAFLFTPEPLGAPLPASMTTADLDSPGEIENLDFGNGLFINDDFICAGHTLTADGQVFTTGGTREYRLGPNTVYRGTPTTSLFDGTSWTRTTNMVETGTLDRAYRWYPTATRLPDARILITGGFEQVSPNPAVNASTEVYDPETGTSTVASPYGATPPEIWQSDYTHVWVLPYANAFHDILMIGERGIPILNSSEQLDSWEVRPSEIRPGATGGGNTNNGTSSVMLPFRLQNGQWSYANGAILNVGGGKGTTFIDQAEVYDPVLRRWSDPIDLGVPRHHPDTVILPDSRIAIVAGHNVTGNTGVLQAQYIDPANDFALTNGTSVAQQMRGYHSIALLLPDGRILVAGGRDEVTTESQEKPTYQYLEPDYIGAERPEILAASTTELGYKSTFGVWVDGPRPTEAVMISLGSMTHSIDMNQRSIQVRTRYFKGPGNTHVLQITAPPDANTAPPGHYMLFVLDKNRVPSEATIVHID